MTRSDHELMNEWRCVRSDVERTNETASRHSQIMLDDRHTDDTIFFLGQRVLSLPAYDSIHNWQ